MSCRVLFFSRGRGHGHAVPDLAIAREILRLQPDWEIVFASYATGRETLCKAGWPCIDMGLPEDNPYLQTLVCATRISAEVQPDIIVAHEEFPALVAARQLRIPALFVSAWLPIRPGLPADSMAFADSIVLLEQEGVFAPPPGTKAELRCVGPMRRDYRCSLQDRPRARAELNLTQADFVVCVHSGGAFTEEKAPLAHLLASALATLPENTVLLWLAGRDAVNVRAQLAGASFRWQAFDFVESVEQVLVASDVVVTKGTRGATLDAHFLGLPSISVSPGLNAIDDMLVPRITSNLALNLRAVTPRALGRHIEELRLRQPALVGRQLRHCTSGEVAAVFVEEIERMICASGSSGGPLGPAYAE